MRLITIAVLFVSVSCTSHETSSHSQTEGTSRKATALSEVEAGQHYEHLFENSRFEVGPNAESFLEGGYEKVAGTKGTFATFGGTRATRGVRSAPASEGRGSVALDDARGFTDNPDTAMEATRNYFVSHGLPENEVGGMHVTTTMGGAASLGEDFDVSRDSELMWYTGHLDRVVSEIPVESSYAFAAFGQNDAAITEGVWWPDIPVEVVQDGVDLRQALANAGTRQDFLALIEAEVPGASDVEGEVRIIHTNATYDGEFTVHAAYCVALVGEGKARVPCFANGTGERVVLPDSVPTDVDSMKEN